MRMPGIDRLRHAARQIRNRFRPTSLILLYHRVTKLRSDPQLLCVTPQHFSEHLDVLRKDYNPLRLQGLSQDLRCGTVPRRAVVVTFDDGYADNLYNAKPVLEHFNIPATIFVATGSLGLGREFWWDELDRLLLQPRRLPETLRININGSAFEADLNESAYYGEDDFQRYCRWNVTEHNDPTSRQALYRTLCQLFRPLPEEERQKALEELRAWAGVEPACRLSHHVLSPDEVIQLTNDDLVEVGAHTVSHSVLSALPMAVQRAEIEKSKARLEEIQGRPVTSFSYPYGLPFDYTAETVAGVKEAGFDCACSNFPGKVQTGTDPYQLPRFLVRNWTGREFESQLKEFWIQ
jgi:peptidoglycan/xylan/chitin deacetylase (PgdA/CDA1 family)